MMKEVDQKLKGIDKENEIHLKALEDFETLTSAEFEDLD